MTNHMIPELCDCSLGDGVTGSSQHQESNTRKTAMMRRGGDLGTSESRGVVLAAPNCSLSLPLASKQLTRCSQHRGASIEKSPHPPAMRFSARARPTRQCGDLTLAEQLAWSSGRSLAAVACSADSPFPRSPRSTSLLGRRITGGAENAPKFVIRCRHQPPSRVRIGVVEIA